MPALTDFNLTDPAAWPIAADALQEDGAGHLPAYLRAPVVQPQTDPFRVAWDTRHAGASPLADARLNRAYWPERFKTDRPRVIVFRLPELVGKPACWVAEVYETPGKRTTGPESDTPEGAAIALAGCLLRLGNRLEQIDALFAESPRAVSVRLGSEERPDWWERA